MTTRKTNVVRVLAIVFCIILMLNLSGCAGIGSKINDLKGSITGNTYTCQFYSNEGQKFMTVEGQNIEMKSNIVHEKTYSDGGWGLTETMSSVITITIDGHQIENCGTSVLFIEKGLEPDVNFNYETLNIMSEAEGITDWSSIANIVNVYKNQFGKPITVVIQSQLGDPICAFSGDKVYWEVCEDLPKTTKLYIDNHALYIHRANFQIVDTALLNTSN